MAGCHVDIITSNQIGHLTRCQFDVAIHVQGEPNLQIDPKLFHFRQMTGKYTEDLTRVVISYEIYETSLPQVS